MTFVKSDVFELLSREGFSSTSKYEEASNCAAYRDMVPVTGQRKQLFAEFLNFIRIKEKDDKRKQVQQARIDFMEAVKGFITPDIFDTVTFGHVSKQFKSTPVWKLLTEEELEDIYESVMEDLERSDFHVRARNDRVASIKTIFAQDERYNADTPFDKILCFFPNHSKLELLLAWQEFVAARDRADASRKRQLRQRKERKARIAFRALLLEIGTKPWAELHPLIKDRDCYIELIGSRGSQPFDLFVEAGGADTID